MIPNETLAYLAGVMDSDGYFSIKKSTWGKRVKGDRVSTTYHAKIGAKQVEPSPAIYLLKETFGGYLRVEEPSAYRGKRLTAWQCTDAQAESAIKLLRPYLRIKPKQADLLLELRAIQSEGRTAIWENEHLDRWGRIRLFHNRCYSVDQLSRMDALYMGVRGLNDTRWINVTKE